MRLQGKVACITGAGQDIGRAIALQFAREGAIVLLNDFLHSDTLANLVDEILTLEQHAQAIEGDGTSQSEVKRMVGDVLQTYQHIDIWVNAATGASFGAAEGGNPVYHSSTDEERFRHLLNIDVKGTFVCCRAIAPVMKSQGSGCIINISWDAALIEGMAGMDGSMYAAAKGAVHSLSLSFALRYAPAVRVNVIAPGTMDSGSYVPHTAGPPAPLGRFCTPEDIAQAALYLASSEALYITGQTFVVNGGSIMY